MGPGRAANREDGNRKGKKSKCPSPLHLVQRVLCRLGVFLEGRIMSKFKPVTRLRLSYSQEGIKCTTVPPYNKATAYLDCIALQRPYLSSFLPLKSKVQTSLQLMFVRSTKVKICKLIICSRTLCQPLYEVSCVVILAF